MKKIIQITDTHLFSSPDTPLSWIDGLEIYSNTQLEKTIRHIKKQETDADHIIFTGDIAEEMKPKTYKLFKSMIRDIDIPISILPGNHDENASFYIELNKNTIRTNCNIQYPHWQILMIDSSLCSEPYGYLSNHQFQNIQKRLEHSSKNTLIALHHHPLETKSRWIDKHMLKNGDQFISLIKQYSHVKGVIFGHIHQAFDHTLHHIRFLGCPSTCVQFTPNLNTMKFDHHKPGYRTIELHDNGLLNTNIHYLDYDS